MTKQETPRLIGFRHIASARRTRPRVPDDSAGPRRAMVVYVCSPLASANNGATLRVDGGVVRSIV